MLQVGINNDVRLVRAEHDNEKHSLTLFFAQGELKGKTKDVLSMLNETTDNSEKGKEHKVMIWSLDVTGYNQEPETATRILQKINTLKAQLTQILLGYAPSNKIVWKLDKGAGLTATNFNTKIQDQDVLDIVNDNLMIQFIEMFEKLGDPSKLFRLRLCRQSKAKHYGTLPYIGIHENKFFEPMEIDKNLSMVKFSGYEIGKGLDDPTPITSDFDNAEKRQATDKVTDLLGEEEEDAVLDDSGDPANEEEENVL